MKKYVICLSAVLYSSVLQAQALDMSEMVNSMKMSSAYLNHLADCAPYQEKKSMEFMGVAQDSVYKVVGKQGDDCLVEITSQTNNNVHVVQKCRFASEDLARYVKASRELIKRTQYTVDNVSEMVSDDNYVTAMGIMMTACEARRDEIDATKEIRKNLADCQPYTYTEKQGPVEITRRIVGQNGAFCDYEQTIFMKAPDLSKISGELADTAKNVEVPDMHFTYKCAFSVEKLQEFIKVLESLVIPAGDAMDFSVLDDFDPKAEMDFISENCTLEKQTEDTL